jgi:hypothetical protein
MTKICKDCANYVVYETGGGIRIRHECNHESNVRYSPVIGDVTPKYRIEMMRALPNLCGPDAFHFQPVEKKASKRK